MNKHKIMPQILVGSMLFFCLSLSSCKPSLEEPDASAAAEKSSLSTESEIKTSIPESTENSLPCDTQAVESSENTASSATIEADTRLITLNIVNTCGIDIGMISCINPTTKEQVDIGSLPSNTKLTLELLWPNDQADFQWALYNTDGVLCMECKTDISEANSSATLTLTGEGNVENITAQFE